ncbi:cation:proton antiporter regulatory subunit [Actinomadura yumaensis]|uniref:cation:proton antiporter regulatory subunit n=1 Tax=Actinomadura yumaensis TaxID=111807 RepID=UPI003613E1F5
MHAARAPAAHAPHTRREPAGRPLRAAFENTAPICDHVRPDAPPARPNGGTAERHAPTPEDPKTRRNPTTRRTNDRGRRADRAARHRPTARADHRPRPPDRGHLPPQRPPRPGRLRQGRPRHLRGHRRPVGRGGQRHRRVPRHRPHRRAPRRTPAPGRRARHRTARHRPRLPYDGRPLGDTQARTRSGASIVAVVRSGQVHASPRPDFVFAAGDTVVVVGTGEEPPPSRRSSPTADRVCTLRSN